jgi:uncharacterized protein involved in outer membrane biogenesis
VVKLPQWAVLPRRRGARVALGLLLGGVLALGVGEALGWPFLGPAVERWLSARLDRSVSLIGSGDRSALRLRLLGGVSVQTPRLVVASPAWSRAGAMLEADDARLKLRYSDLLAWRRGGPLHVDTLTARRLAVRVERLKDGRASWQFGAPREGRPMLDGVVFGEVGVQDGYARIDDAQLDLALQGKFAWKDDGLVADAQGRYRGLPTQASARSGPAEGNARALQLRIDAGRAKLEFDGRLRDPFGEPALDGRYTLRGPSLAAAGAPFGVTLPTTPAFSMQGTLDGSGNRWHTVVSAARIGASRLAGEFVFDRGRQRPLLSGTLTGSNLRLADLGPAIGVATPETPAPRRAGRVLPARAFNLPSLRNMDADVQLRIERLETGHAALQDIRPLHARLRLADGVLELGAIDARMARGRVGGRIQLDGRRDVARWDVALTLRGLVLEEWLRSSGPPTATGRIAARLNLTGQGRSTADMLASADGRAVLHWTRGTLSHQLVEAAGIDIAESLGVMLRGDRPLAVNCAAADLRIADGRATPALMLADTSDSTLQVEGALSLATERLDLVLRARPKDFSIATLRSPVHVEGSFADPQIRLDRSGVLRRVLPAALLAAVNPLAALLPLIDPGEDEDGQALAACRAVNQAAAK